MVRVALHFQTLEIILCRALKPGLLPETAHDTKIPNFKFWLNILRGYSTSFGEVIKGKILKFGIGNSRSIGKEEVPLFATVRSKGRFTYSGVESSFFLFFFLSNVRNV